jgi:RHS repeat-associated protein
MAYIYFLRRNLALKLLFSVGAVILFSMPVMAQIRNTTDGLTPSGLAPGAPAGSYPLSEFENINLYNGQASFTLPVMQKGRGGANISLPIRIVPNSWSVESQRIDYPNIPFGGLYQDVFNAQLSWWNETTSRAVLPGGRLIGRYVSENAQVCDSGLYFMKTNTRLTFTAPDGTEYNLRDTVQNGNPRIGACWDLGNNYRGNIFVTSDGTSATFYSQSAYADVMNASDPQNTYAQATFYPSGYLMLKDGTRYDISNGYVTRMRDRNGNEVRYEPIYGQSQHGPFLAGWTITDSLNRQIVINFDVNDGDPYGVVDRITFKGFGGANRYIRIKYGAPLRITQPTDPTSPWSMQQLFPELDNYGGGFGGSARVSTIWLPDGRTYNFKYNVYRELARVELPTGGAIEYDYSGGELGGTSSGVMGYYQTPRYPVTADSTPPLIAIYRRLVERRIYSGSDISTLVGKTTYSKPENIEDPVTHEHSSNLLVEQLDPNSGACLARSKHYFKYSAYDSLLRLSAANAENILEGKEFRTEALDTSPSMAVLRNVENVWLGPNIIESKTAIIDANLVSKQTFSYDQYDNQTDVYEHDFGVGAPGPWIRHTHTDYVTSNNGLDYAGDNNIHIRSLPLRQQVFDVGEIKRVETFYEYDNYNSDGLLHAPLSEYTNISGHDSAFSAGYIIRGNVTKTARALLNDTGAATGWINSYAQYDIAGNVVKVVDGRTPAGITTFEFLDRFGSPDNDARSNAAPPELAGVLSYAFPTKVTNALQHTAYTKYDYYLGKPVNTEDANGVVSSIEYNDALDRPTQSIQAKYVVGQGVPLVKRQTTITYEDANHVITTRSDLNTYLDNALTSKAYYDGLGRTWRGAAYEGNSSWTIKDTQFDALGRVSQVSNPYSAADPLSASAPGDLWTMTEYDGLGRMVKVTTPDHAHVDTTYNGNQVTVTDQAGKQRRSETDALGRLVKVTEAPDTLNYDTTYLYDVLGNLRKVTQGVQTRWFAYDSLSRLIRAKNPEQDVNTNPNMSYIDPVTQHNGWSMAYSYDANGNLVSKTDANNITTTYEYDKLNRNTAVDYSDTTTIIPDIARVYDYSNDPTAYGKGRLWLSYAHRSTSSGTYSEHTAIDRYDPLGRPRTNRQQFAKNGVWSEAYSANYTYDLAGNVRGLTYPSGHFVDYNHGQESGRLSRFSGNLGGLQKTYADTISYNAAGQMVKEQFGTNTPLYHNSHYNNRMQMVTTRLGDSATDEWNWSRGVIDFFYGTTAIVSSNYFANSTDNNGNLRKQMSFVPLAGGGNVATQVDDYTYDALNRISSFTEGQMNSSGQWTPNVASQNFSYDQYGNRKVTSASSTLSTGVSNYNPNYNQATNRIDQIGGPVYDAAGNIKSDLLNGGPITYDYDQENRLRTTSSGGAYTYDADGKRTRRTEGGQEKWYIYGIGGELLAEYAANDAPVSPQKEYGYRAGQLLIVAESGSGGSTSLVKPNSKSSSDLIAKKGSGARRAANRMFSVDKPYTAFGHNKGYGSITAKSSGSDNTGTLLRGGPRTTADGYGNAPSANGVGGKSLAGHPGGGQPAAPQKEYRNRKSLSIVAAQSASPVYATGNQTPAYANSSAVNSPLNMEHAWTNTSADSNSSTGSVTQDKSCRWFAFQPVSGQIISVTLKFDWAAQGYISTNAPESGTGSASATALFQVSYSTDNGSNFTTAKEKYEYSSVYGSGSDYRYIDDSGSVSVNLPANTPINQIVVRDRIYSDAYAYGAGSESASSSVNGRIYNIRLEVVRDFNAAAFVSQNVPATMTAGESYPVTVSMLNQGTTTWTTANGYVLGSQSSQDNPTNTTWGTQRVYLAAGETIPPGGSKTFSFQVVAPSSPGSYNFQWQMVQEGVEWFGAKTPNIAVQVVSRNDSATFISQTVPSVMGAGAAYPVSITFRNTGNTTWTAANQYRLGSQNPVNNGTWGFGRVYLEAGELVPPDALKTFTFQVVAPSTPGLYNFQWQMLRELVNWFGSASTNLVVVAYSPTDTTPPTVSSSSPSAGATNVNVSANVTVTFNEAMNPSTISASTIELRDSSNVQVPATVSYNASTFTATLDPNASLEANTIYTVRIRGAGADPRVKDAAGNALAADLTWTFNTGLVSIKWLVQDHLGSTRMVIDETGSLAGITRRDYAPFGEEMYAGIRRNGSGQGQYGYEPPQSNVRQKFGSKERDIETGLDYFLARYYSSVQGRFTSVDPSNLSIDWWIPQSWNRYAYTLNNPLSYVDKNGLWPTPIHNLIIDESLPGLSQQQLQILKKASSDTDYTNQVDIGGGHMVGPQDPAASFVHGMRDGLTNQDPAVAQGLGDEFIKQNEDRAKEIQAKWIASGNTGIAPAALTAFGNALHTIMDRTSPAHKGNQPWYGTGSIRYKVAALAHVNRELDITYDERIRVEHQVRVEFLQVFGKELFLKAYPPPPPRPLIPKTKMKIKFLNDDGSEMKD